MLVEPDPETLEGVLSGLGRHLDAHVTCVSDGETCLDADMNEPHELIITEMELPDRDGLELAEQLLSLRSRPVILMADELSVEDTIDAMRIGVRDVFLHPFELDGLAASAERLLDGFRLRQQHAARYRRMRSVVRRAIRERREIDQRVELVCKDLVSAQRRLVHRVMEIDHAQAARKPDES